MNIADGLREARKRAGMSIDDVAMATGFLSCEIAGYENGTHVPLVMDLISISRVLNFTISWPLGTINGANSSEGAAIFLNKPLYLEESGEAANWRHGAPCSQLFGVYWHYYRVKHVRMMEARNG